MESDFTTADTVSLAPDQQRTGIDAQLTTGATISGRVTGPTGEALEGICVEVDGGGDLTLFGKTDASGHYSVSPLPASTFKVGFSACSVALYVGEWWNDRPDFDSADPIPLTTGQHRPDIDAQLASAGAIHGHVTKPTVGTVCIDAYPATAKAIDQFTGAVAGTETSGAGGDYTIGGLLPGFYKVRFRDCGTGQNLATAFYDSKADLGSADVITVAAGQITTGINVTMVVGGSISGRVTDTLENALGGVCVGAEVPTTGALVTGTVSGVNGNYTVTGLAPGAYHVHFATTGCPFATAGELAPQWFDGKARASNADIVTVTAGQTVSSIDAPMAPPDTQPPDTSIASGPTGTTTETVANFAFAASEAEAAFECRLDGSDWSNCTSPKTYVSLADGQHTFTVRATDAAGNTDATPATRTWTIDTKAAGAAPPPGPGPTTGAPSCLRR